MVKTVLVLGASYAGLAVSHRLLKYTRPKQSDLRVVLISKSTHFYWNIAAIRAVVPGLLTDEQVFHAIEPGFTAYPKDAFELVVASATGLDTDSKTAVVRSADGTEKSLAYDYLVLATGARAVSENVPWKPQESHEATVELLRKTADKVKDAKHIVIAGAGATGCETSAEIRHEYQDKEVVLLAADPEILGGDVLAGNMEKEIMKLGVQVKKNSRVEGARVLEDGKTEVVLTDGNKIITDLYLPTMGLMPNSEFIDKKHLNERNYAEIDDFYQVKGAKNVWACGDVVSKPRAGFVLTDKQAAGVAKNVELALQDKPQLPVKLLPADILFCAAGRDRGAGRIGWFKVPSIMAWAAKGRTLGLQNAAKYVDGSQW